MKSKLLLLLLPLVAGCFVTGYEAHSEYEERFEYMHQLSSDARVVAILAHKPDKVIYVLGDRRALDIYVNSPITTKLIDPDQRETRPGNMYTSDELKVIEDVAVELSKRMRVKRPVYIYDVTGDREWRVDDRKATPDQPSR